MKRNTKFIVLGVVILALVATAAFIGGRFLNQQAANPFANPFQPGGEGRMAISGVLEFQPAPELPTTNPVVTGPFGERKDNTIFVHQISMPTGSGGGVVVSGSAVSAADTGSAMPNIDQGPKVEVVINSKTKIYQDVTPMDFNPGEETKKIQQTLEPGSLDDLNKNTMVTVWGRKVGDRLIADVIVYSEPFSVVK